MVATKKTDWTLEKRFGEVVTRRRKELKMTQEELAHLSGLSPSAIQKYEAGEREPRSRALLQLAKTLDTTIDYLLEDTRWIQPEIGSKGYFETRVRPVR